MILVVRRASKSNVQAGARGECSFAADNSGLLYQLRNGQAHVLGKRAMEVGPATVERATRGRYDWQDGGLRKRRREEEIREEGERRLRPRDPGKKGRHS